MSQPFRTIGICVDDSEAARTAVEAGRAVAGPDTSITLLHVVEQRSFLVELAMGISGGITSDTDALIAAAQAWLESLAEGGERVAVLTGHPAQAIAEWATQAGADLLVTATARSRAEHALLGSVSRRLSELARCSVLLVHPGTETVTSS